MNNDNRNRNRLAFTRRRLLQGATAAAGGLALTQGRLFTPALAQSMPLKVGVLAPLSGVYSSLGTNKLNGIKMLFEEKNMMVGDRKVELVIEDTEAKPQEGLRKARKLVEQDEVDVLLGVISSAIGYALKEYADRAERVWITTGAAADGIFTPDNNSPYAYRSSLAVWQANNPMGKWLGDQGFKRVFEAGPDYAMGHEAIAAFSAPFIASGAEKVGEVFAPLGTSDFAPFLAEIKRAQPDLVYASFAGGDAVRFVQQFADFGLKDNIRLAGYGYLVEEDTFPAQGDAAEGIYSTLNWAYGIDTPANKSFVSTYEDKYESAPTVDSVAGYVGAQVVWEAFNSLGGEVKSQQDLSEAVLATKIDTPRGPVSFDPETRNVIQNIYIREVQKMDGKLHNAVLDSYENVRSVPGE